jgi:hypothetical protein
MLLALVVSAEISVSCCGPTPPRRPGLESRSVVAMPEPTPPAWRESPPDQLEGFSGQSRLLPRPGRDTTTTEPVLFVMIHGKI